MTTQIEIIPSTNFQNEKIENHISILGRSFRYSDKRGYSTYAMIDWDFAIEIMDLIPAKVLHTQRVLDMVNTNVGVKLSWSCFGVNKKQREAGLKETYELRIHAAGEHLYTSINQ